MWQITRYPPPSTLRFGGLSIYSGAAIYIYIYIVYIGIIYLAAAAVYTMFIGIYTELPNEGVVDS